HESVGFTRLEEIASGQKYEGKVKLGNTHKGDGRRYKGRGLIQLTGRKNYREAGEFVGEDLEGHPELAKRPDLAARIAGWYWRKHDLNGLADSGDFTQITEIINGGQNGKLSRARYFARAREAMAPVDA